MHIFGILDQPVKVIGINTVIFQESMKVKKASDIKRNVGILGISQWQFPFVYRKHDHVLKIQKTGFQQPHDLQPPQRLPWKSILSELMC